MTIILHPALRALLPLFLSLFVFIPSTAQQTEGADSATTANRMHSQGILLHIWPIQGISYVVPLSEQSGLRLSAEIDIQADDDQTTWMRQRLEGGATVDSSGDKINQSSFEPNIDIIALYVGHLSLNNHMYGYAGIGPLGSVRWNSYNDSYANPLWNDFTNRTEQRGKGFTWELGLQGVIGIQTFPTSSVSLFGEMELSGRHSWQSMATESWESADKDHKTRTEYLQKRWIVSTNLARFGIGIHF